MRQQVRTQSPAPSRRRRVGLVVVSVAALGVVTLALILSQMGGHQRSRTEDIGALAAPAGPSRLSQPRDYGANDKFRPAQANQNPRMIRSAAWQAWQAAKIYPDAPNKAKHGIDVLFATWTSASGTQNSDGSVTPQFVDKPVWLITFHGYPATLAGDPTPFDADLVIVIDDTTGTVLETFTDSTAYAQQS